MVPQTNIASRYICRGYKLMVIILCSTNVFTQSCNVFLHVGNDVFIAVGMPLKCTDVSVSPVCWYNR